METLIVIGLCVAVFWLWNQLEEVKRKLSFLEQLTFDEPEHFEPAGPIDAAGPVPDVSAASRIEPEAEPALAEAETPAPETEATPEPATSAPDEVESPLQEAATYTADDDFERSEYVPEERFQFDFEDIFGRRLPIWAGGITLAIAGVFLVRYSIEAGLMTPVVRVFFAFLFGILLLAGAEFAYRNEDRVADPRVRQALAGAGLATLYAGFYLAGTQYGLIGQTFAFLGLAAVTAGAIALSYRFGLPCAILGLVGGFAAPVLIGGDEANLPLLSLYLGLVTAGLTVTGARQKRPWLSIAALVFGLGWGALLLLSAETGIAEILALGLYLIVLGTVLPSLAGAEQFEKPLRFGSALVASVQLALLVDQGGYSPLAWGLYLLLGGALAFFAWQRSDLRPASAIAAVVGLLLLAQWDGAAPVFFALVTAGLAAVYAAVPLAHIWRGDSRQIDLLQLTGIPPALAIVAYGTFGKFGHDLIEPQLALACFALALLPLAGAWRLWRDEVTLALALLSGSSALLIYAGLLLVTPIWAAGIAATLVFAALFAVTHRRIETLLGVVLWGAAGISLIALFATAQIDAELGRLVGESGDANPWRALIRWIAAALPWAALAWREQRMPARQVAEVLAALLVYGALAQLLPQPTLAWMAALAAIGCWFLQRERIAAQITLVAITALWAFEPIAIWLVGAISALAGDPMLVSDTPDLQLILTGLLPIIAALACIRVSIPHLHGEAFDSRALALPLVFVTLHILFKNGLAISSAEQFVQYGMMERTIWQGLLLSGAWLAYRGLPYIGVQKALAFGLAALSLGHALLFNGLLHNPLWDQQAVGPIPVLNLLLPASAIAIMGALFLRRLSPPPIRPFLDAIVMVIVGIGALALLRQGFAGSVLVGTPMGAAEDLLRSLLGIMLALLFLFIGSRLGERSWRIGSLVLMLIAVAKVFLIDAAGLESLLRIASFMALGFSLIGIGWVYTRQLKQRAPDTVTD